MYTFLEKDKKKPDEYLSILSQWKNKIPGLEITQDATSAAYLKEKKCFSVKKKRVALLQSRRQETETYPPTAFLFMISKKNMQNM